MNRNASRSRGARTLSFLMLLIVSLLTAQLALAPLASAQNPTPSTPVVDGAAPPARLTIPIPCRARPSTIISAPRLPIPIAGWKMIGAGS